MSLLDGVEWLMRFCWRKKSVETKLFYYDDDRYFWWESVKLSSFMYYVAWQVQLWRIIIKSMATNKVMILSSLSVRHKKIILDEC